MNTIIYLASLLVCFSGLIVGVFLAYIAPEELKGGKKYLLIIRNITLSFMIAVSYYFVNKIAALVILIVSFILFSRIKTSEKIIYALTAILLIISQDKPIFLIEASLILFYGFVIGTLFTMPYIKKNILTLIKKVVITHYLFLLIGLIGLVKPFI